eukprot:scpid83845/ scgid21315/ 
MPLANQGMKRARVVESCTHALLHVSCIDRVKINASSYTVCTENSDSGAGMVSTTTILSAWWTPAEPPPLAVKQHGKWLQRRLQFLSQCLLQEQQHVEWIPQQGLETEQEERHPRTT